MTSASTCDSMKVSKVLDVAPTAKPRKLKAKWSKKEIMDDLRAYHGLAVTELYDVWWYEEGEDEPRRYPSPVTYAEAEEIVQDILASGRCAYSKRRVEGNDEDSDHVRPSPGVSSR